MFTIYALVDPRDQSYRYVGCTAYPRHRLQMHVVASRHGKAPSSVWIRDLIAHGFMPVMRILERSWDTSSASAVEIDWIAKLKLAGCPLTNVSRGGGVRLFGGRKYKSDNMAHRLVRPDDGRLRGNRRRLGPYVILGTGD